jgi:hypothetical protein
MRDIRPDLRERLGSIEQERARIKATVQGQLEELDQQEVGVKALLQQEERRFASNNGNGIHHAADGGTTPLSRLILAYLRNSNGPVSMDDIKASALANKFDFGEKAPGRVIHWGLVGMQQGGIVEKKGGKWHLKEVTQ